MVKNVRMKSEYNLKSYLIPLKHVFEEVIEVLDFCRHLVAIQICVCVCVCVCVLM